MLSGYILYFYQFQIKFAGKMNGLITFAALLFLAFVVTEISAKCCGRGKNGFCNDCSRVGLFRHRKCCGAGSGYGHGCNIFCCKCGKCKRGVPVITFKSGWWTRKKYSCRQHRGDTEQTDLQELKDTWDAFSEIDLDQDNVISPVEFMDALSSKLDSEEATLLASDLMQSNDVDKVGAFLDALNEDGAQDSMLKMIADEFKKLDENGDGLIQAQEFDGDLKQQKKL